MNRDLLLAILAMDSYNRGYGSGVTVLDESGSLGDFTIREFGDDEQEGWQSAGFYAIAYEWQGETVIAYRGSDYDEGVWNDVFKGWRVGLGFPAGGQPALAMEFYTAVTGITVTGAKNP